MASSPKMSAQQYAQSVLKVAIAQICQTIGWHSTHASTMDLLIDVTQHFLREISRIMHAYCELYNRTEANMDDLALAYKDVGINLDELMEYIQFVDPIPMPFEVPRFPLPTESNLNFLKPGSREVLMRPVHIPEYMPPMFFEEEEGATAERADATEDEQQGAVGGKVVPYGGEVASAKSLLTNAAMAIASALSDVRALGNGAEATTSGASIEEIPTTSGTSGVVSAAGDDGSILSQTVANEVEVEAPTPTVEVKDLLLAAAVATAPANPPAEPATAGKDAKPVTDQQSKVEGRPTREISSVIMTTSGFISPAREGRLPDSRIPYIPEERPKPLTPAAPPPPPPLPGALAVPAPPVPAAPLSTVSTPPSTSTSTSAGASNVTPSAGVLGASTTEESPMRHGIPFGAALTAGDPIASLPAPPKAASSGTEKIPKKVKKKPADRERKKVDKGAGPSSGARKAAQLAFLVPPPADEDMKDVKLFPGGANLLPDSPAAFGTSALLNPKKLPATPPTPGRTLVKQEKPKKRSKAALKAELAASKAMMDREIVELKEGIPAPDMLDYFDVKPKSRPKASKKASNQRQPPPLIAPPGLGTAGFGVGSIVPNPLHFAAQTNDPPPALFGAGVSAIPRKIGPPSQQPVPGPGPPPAPDQMSQLNLLQMRHPSLEITASPAPKPEPDAFRDDRDVIVIDDDKSPPHVQHASQLPLPPMPATPSTKAKKGRTQEPTGVMPTYSSPGATFPHDSPGFGSSSPHTPTTGLPKTPDIRLQSSPSSTASWPTGDSGRMLLGKKGTPANLFEMGALPPIPASVTIEPATGKKPKRPRQKPKGEPKRAKLALKQQQEIMPPQAKPLEQLQQQQQQQQQQQPQPNQPQPDRVKNPFAMFPGGINPFAPNPAAYSKYLSQSMPGGLRGSPMPFGLFPLPSGPGLIPDNPLFPRLPPAYPGQARPGFPIPNPFGLPDITQQINNLLRMPRPPGLRHPLGGAGGSGMGGPMDFLDEPLDPETKLAQTPLDLQKSTCNVAPLVPPSLFQSAGNANELLNLSVKPSVGATAVKHEAVPVAMVATSSLFADASTPTVPKEPKPEPSAYKEDQVVILPAASVLLGASPSQRSNLLVIDVDDSDGSQSTATTGGKSKDGAGGAGGAGGSSKRPGAGPKQKEHKKDRKLKEGKIKKKKDKKDKSKGKEREREREQHGAVSSSSSSTAMLTMGMIGAEEAELEQLRKQRKDKKEKRKEKLKKEKRKERDRVGVVGAGAGAAAGTPTSTSTDVVPKLMLKIGGSNATQSPRSETDLAPTDPGAGGATKRDGSPELARISALVTRPPKLKAGGGVSGKRDDTGGTASGSTLDSKPLGFPSASGTDVELGTGGLYPTSTQSDAVRASPEPSVSAPKATPHGDKPARAAKESKSGSKSAHHHHHAGGPVADAFNAAPAHMTDVDGNTVWICPACGRVDDGTPMIGCDGCDAWYHWVCVGIQVPPEDNEDWYCRVCIAKKQDPHADAEKQRKRKKKDKKTAKD
uniref:PHD-type domain-containing protein n=1 Tax=Anopheles farauti TaxID=69004 RepID=A0A182QHS4_9DIPT